MDGDDRPLRVRQADEVRHAILDAVLAELEARPVDDVSMADIARASGVSLRTLYRYFPDRTTLLEAAGSRLYAALGVPIAIAGPEAIGASFLEAARRLATRAELARALVRTSAGRTTRAPVRAERVGAVHRALEPLIGRVDADTGRRAAAVIASLCSAASWVTIADESGLEAAEAQEAVRWAIDTLVGALEDAARAPSVPGPGLAT